MSTQADPTPAEEHAQPGLRRVISRRLLMLFVIGDILGAGVYALTGEVAGEVGGALWAPFVVAFVVALLTAVSYMELVSKYPGAAGAALYTHRAFGLPFLTFLVAFAVMSSGLTSASTSARAFGGDYLAEFVSLPTVAVAVAFVLVLSAVNFRGVSESMKANVVLTLVELTGLAVIVAIGVTAVVTGAGNPERLTQFAEGKGPVLAMLGGAALAFFAFVGFEDSVNMAEEVEEPRRTYPRAVLPAFLVVTVVYLAVAVTSSLLVPSGELQGSSAPLLEVVEAGGLNFPPELFAAIALFALTNTALINLIMASRLVYGMARERIVPGVLGRVHPRRRTPWVAIVFTAALALGLVSTGEVEQLGSTTALLLLCVFSVVNVAVLVLRRRHAEHAHFRAPTWVPVLGAVTCVVLATPVAGHEASTYVTAVVLLGIGLVLWVVNRLVVGPAQRVDAERLTG